MLGETPVGFPQQLVSQSQIGFGVSKVAVPHIGGQKGQFGIDEDSLAVPAEEPMDRESAAQFMQMG